MKTLHSLPLLWLLALPALAAEQVNQTLDAPANLLLDVKVQRGKVEFSPWDQPKVQVQGTLDELSEGLVFENRDGRILLEDKMPKSYQGNNSAGSMLVIKVPANLTLSAEAISADIKLANLNGELTLGTVSGDINAQTLSGKLQVNSVSGDIGTSKLSGAVALETVSGTITDTESTNSDGRYKSVSGDINLKNQAETVRIEQVSGDTEASLGSAGSLKYNAVSGDAKLSVKGDVKLSAESVSGDIALSLLTNPDVRLSINGGPGGAIHNGLSDDKPLSPKYGPGSKLETRIGEGKGVIEVSTLSGDISLKK